MTVLEGILITIIFLSLCIPGFYSRMENIKLSINQGRQELRVVIVAVSYLSRPMRILCANLAFLSCEVNYGDQFSLQIEGVIFQCVFTLQEA